MIHSFHFFHLPQATDSIDWVRSCSKALQLDSGSKGRCSLLGLGPRAAGGELSAGLVAGIRPESHQRVAPIGERSVSKEQVLSTADNHENNHPQSQSAATKLQSIMNVYN